MTQSKADGNHTLLKGKCQTVKSNEGEKRLQVNFQVPTTQPSFCNKNVSMEYEVVVKVSKMEHLNKSYIINTLCVHVCGNLVLATKVFRSSIKAMVPEQEV